MSTVLGIGLSYALLAVLLGLFVGALLATADRRDNHRARRTGHRHLTSEERYAQCLPGWEDHAGNPRPPAGTPGR